MCAATAETSGAAVVLAGERLGRVDRARGERPVPRRERDPRNRRRVRRVTGQERRCVRGIVATQSPGRIAGVVSHDRGEREDPFAVALDQRGAVRRHPPCHLDHRLQQLPIAGPCRDLGERHNARNCGEIGCGCLLEDRLVGLRLGARVRQSASREPQQASVLRPALQQVGVAIASTACHAVVQQPKCIVEPSNVNEGVGVVKTNEMDVRLPSR